MSNNPPFRTIDLDEETFHFLLANCESNIAFGLNTLQNLERKEAQIKMVELLENFKKLRDLLKSAR